MAKRNPAKTSPTKAKAKGRPKKTKPKARTRAQMLKDYRTRMGVAGVTRVSTIDAGKSTVRGWISTQSVAVDTLLGGGIPLGKIVEVYGPPHVGKSTFLDHCFAEVQKADGLAVLADVEYSRAASYSRSLGVDTDAIAYLEWADTEQHIENVVNALYESAIYWIKEAPDMPVLLGWDALGSTAAQADLKVGLGAKLKVDPKTGEKKRASKPGAAAKAMRMAMRQIGPAIAGSNVGVVILNHQYEAINSTGRGPTRKNYGGQGVAFAASVRLAMWPSGVVKLSDGQIVGKEVTVLAEKDRINGATSRRAIIAILTGRGINNVYSIIHELKAAKLIVTSGGWSALNLDGKIYKFQGWRGLHKLCDADPTLLPRLVSVYQTVAAPPDLGI